MVIPILPTTIMTISYAEEENRINSALEALCANTYLSCDEIITALSVLVDLAKIHGPHRLGRRQTAVLTKEMG
jgi:hypothetical protein